MASKQLMERVLIAATGVGALVWFGFDIYMPTNQIVWIPYLALVLVTLWIPRKIYPLLLAALITGLLVLAYAFKPEVYLAPFDEYSRILGIMAIWIVALLCVLHQRLQAKQREAFDQLERLVDIRTRDLQNSNANLGQTLETLEQARNTIQENERRFRLALDHSAVAVFSQDQDLRYTWIYNPPFGLTPEAILGRTDEELFGSPRGEMLNVPKRKVLETGEPLVTEIRFEHEGRTYSFDNRIEPLLGPQGEIAGLIAAVIDNTRHHELERALSESEQVYRFLFNGNPLPMIVYDEQTYRIEAVNEEAVRQIGFSQDAFMGKRLDELVVPDERERLTAYITQHRQEISRRSQWHFLCGDGEIMTVDVISHSIAYSEHPSRMLILQNVTEQQRLQQQVLQLQKMDAIGLLAGGVAHDFNNLLTAVLGFNDLLASELNPDSEEYGWCGEIRRASEQAAQLTRHLLAFGRKQVLQPIRLNINEVIQINQPMLRRLLGEGIELQMALDQNLTAIMADPLQMEQILINLAVNARDAMDKAGRLRIETSTLKLDEAFVSTHLGVVAGPHVLLEVSDNGSGIEKAALERIFEPFYTTKTIGRGTGLGLSIVYGIVKQSGGTIWVDSKPGEGTVFRIYFPCAEGPAESTPERLPASDMEGRRGEESILLVEDEPMVLQMTARALTNYGYRVLTAVNGRDALERYGEYPGPVALMISDVIMPEMDGRELGERMLQLRPDLKILYVSGYTEEGIVQDGVLKPGIEFLAKPYPIRELHRRIREMLDPPPADEE